MQKNIFVAIAVFLVVISCLSGINIPRAAAQDPTITVVSPNGGEIWVQGSTHDIIWTSTGVSSIFFGINDTAGHGLAYGRPISASDGSFSFTVPKDLLAGTKWKVSFTDTATGASDASDNYFSIVAPCAPNWQCGAWSACVSLKQIRSCTDLNSCGVTTGKPILTQSCTVTTTKFTNSQIYTGANSKVPSLDCTRPTPCVSSGPLLPGQIRCPISCLNGAGPLQSGQTYCNNSIPCLNNIGPLLPGQAYCVGVWGSGGSYCSGTLIPCFGNCAGGYYSDNLTAQKLCQLKGYGTASSFTTKNPWSVFPNYFMWNFMWQWNGSSVQYVNSLTANTSIDTVTCKKTTTP